MSGGYWEYDNHRIYDFAETFDDKIEKNNEKPDWYYGDWDGHVYSEETIEEFKKAYAILKIADAYTHRGDWLFSGDDGEESFIRRVKENLNDLIKTDKYGYITKILESLK